ncbi:hypothetical protein [Paraburkholderia ultramafica]|uniref:hypothetical protein n=1 Tax=Paraburkholderia ultramafica TaxID=1544867 RepID=UPI0015829FAD|nr:hypothetical protein [Paraburkholderia ultramafica]
MKFGRLVPQHSRDGAADKRNGPIEAGDDNRVVASVHHHRQLLPFFSLPLLIRHVPDERRAKSAPSAGKPPQSFGARSSSASRQFH